MKTSIKNYEQNYNKLANGIRANENAYNIFKIIYKYIPYLTVFIYLCLIASQLINISSDRIHVFIRIIFVPFSGLVVVSLLRKVFNFPRPYTKYNINPLIKRDKTGESFPSRHTFSICIIAFSCLYINIPLGIVMLIITPILAALRVIAGVHFVKDVVGGIILACIWGILGFYII